MFAVQVCPGQRLEDLKSCFPSFLKGTYIIYYPDDTIYCHLMRKIFTILIFFLIFFTLSRSDLLKSYCSIKDWHLWICFFIHSFSWWNYYVRRNPNHDCCYRMLEIRSVEHLDYFSKYDFNLQSMVYKEKVLVIGYWVRSSNNHSPKLPFPHISFVQRQLFLLLGDILWFWGVLAKDFLETKVKRLKVPKTLKHTKIVQWLVQGWQFGHWKAMLDWRHCQRHNRPEGWVFFPK